MPVGTWTVYVTPAIFAGVVWTISYMVSVFPFERLITGSVRQTPADASAIGPPKVARTPRVSAIATEARRTCVERVVIVVPIFRTGKSAWHSYSSHARGPRGLHLSGPGLQGRNLLCRSRTRKPTVAPGDSISAEMCLFSGRPAPSTTSWVFGTACDAGSDVRRLLRCWPGRVRPRVSLSCPYEGGAEWTPWVLKAPARSREWHRMPDLPAPALGRTTRIGSRGRQFYPTSLLETPS